MSKQKILSEQIASITRNIRVISLEVERYDSAIHTLHLEIDSDLCEFHTAYDSDEMQPDYLQDKAREIASKNTQIKTMADIKKIASHSLYKAKKHLESKTIEKTQAGQEEGELPDIHSSLSSDTTTHATTPLDTETPMHGLTLPSLFTGS